MSTFWIVSLWVMIIMNVLFILFVLALIAIIMTWWTQTFYGMLKEWWR